MPDDDVLREAAESLGVLPDTGMERARGVVLVEGRSDVVFLRHTSTVLREAGLCEHSLEEVGVVPIPIGGCGSVKHWVTMNLADDLGVPWCVFLDSDLGGDAASMKSIQKRKKEVEERGRSFYATRKREIENYLCADMIRAESGIEVIFTDTCDAKKIIGVALGIKPDEVVDKLWPRMTAEQMVQRSRYVDNGNEGTELKELIEGMLSLVTD